MRYLIITAQDDYDNDVVDAVYLEFFDGINSKAVAEALVMNTAEEDDGSLKWVLADDITGNGVCDKVDGDLARSLSRRFLAFKWWKTDRPFNRYLEIYAEDLDFDGRPDLVRLRFHEGDGAPTEETVVKAAACMFLNDAAGRVVTLNEHLNGDSNVDAQGSTLMADLCRDFLKCEWSDVSAGRCRSYLDNQS